MHISLIYNICFYHRSWLDSVIQSATQAKLALLVSAAIYGLSYVISKDLQDHKEFGIKPGLLNGLRFFLASSLFSSDLLQSVSSIISEKLFPKINPSDGRSLLLRDQRQRALVAGLELGLWASLGFLAQSLALQTSSASKVSFFCGLTVVVTPLIAYSETVWLAFKRLLLRSFRSRGENCSSASGSSAVSPSFVMRLGDWMAPCLAVAGAAVLELGDMHEHAHAHSSSATSTYSSLLSDIYLVLTPLAFGVWFHRSETLSAAAETAADEIRRSSEQSSSGGGSVYTRVVTGTMLLVAAMVSCMYSYFMESGGTAGSSPGLWRIMQSRKVAIPMVLFIGLVTTGWNALVEQLVQSMRFSLFILPLLSSILSILSYALIEITR